MSNPAADRVQDKAKSPLVLLQGLRAVAAMMVVVDHISLQRGKVFPEMTYWPRGTISGEAGVDLFFVISGFIMMHITPRPFRTWKDQGAFLFRRAVRIYPPYWAVAIPLLLLWLHDPNVLNSYQGHRVDVISSVLLTPSLDPVVLVVSWSLVAELSYYLIASLIFYLGGQRRLAPFSCGSPSSWATAWSAGRIMAVP